MISAYTDTGDPRASMELLWGLRRRPTRGPRPRLTVEQIAAAAIELADEDGLDAVTMRRLAERLGVTVMSLYTYIPGKAELVDLMLDRVLGWPSEAPDTPERGDASDGGDAPGADRAPRADSGEGRTAAERGGDGVPGWRRRLTAVAWREWELALAHPWLLQVSSARPALGPRVLAWYDWALRAVDGIGLSEFEMDMTIDLVVNYVSGAARSAVAAAGVDQRSGMTDAEWWERVSPMLDEVWPDGRYPVAERVGPVVGERHGARLPPEEDFIYGLERILDGVAVLLRDRSSSG